MCLSKMMGEFSLFFESALQSFCGIRLMQIYISFKKYVAKLFQMIILT